MATIRLKKKFLVYQQGPTGAELGTLGHMATIRLKKKFLVYQQGPTGAELGTLGHMATIRLKKKIPGVPAGANRGRIRDTWTYGNHQTKKKNSWCTSRGQQGQN